MPRRGKHAWQDGEIHESSPQRWFARAVAGFSRGLTTESDRWFLWLPVLFAGGILIYFALPTEPDPTLAIALVIGAAGLAVALKEAPLGLAVAGALLMLASGFATAKLHTELARAPVLARELRYVEVKAWLETIDGQENGRTRATLRVIAVDRLSPDETPYRVRVTGASDMGQNAKTGDAVRLKATLRPPPEPVEPGAFDFGRTAWFSRLGTVGYATSDLERVQDLPSPPLGLALWAGINRLCDPINARVRAALPGQTGDIAAALITGARGGMSDWTASARSIPPNQADKASLHAHPVWTEDAGLIGGVGGFERDRVAAAANALQRRLFFVDQRHDDVAIIGVVAFLDDDGVALEDAGFDHRIAFDLERVMLALGEHLRRHFHRGKPRLDRLDGNAGGDAAHHWNADALRHALAFGQLRHPAQAALDHARREAAGTRRGALRHRIWQLHDLHGPRPMRQPADETPLFQGGNQAVDARLGLEVQGLLHLVEGGGHARFLQPLMNEHEKLFLLRSEHQVPLRPPTSLYKS